MALFDKVDLYTQALNAAFVNAYDAIAEPAPIDKAITIVPSKGRVENYPWIYPPPLLHRWEGFRSYAHLGETNYRVPNVTYSAEFECLFEDLEDAQIDGFKRQAAAMAEGAKEWRGIQSLINLAAGQTTPCFDGSNFFATSHTVGVGNNIVAGTAAAADAVTHAMVALVLKNKVVKPLMWQDREGPSLMTDAGSIEASKNRNVRWWTDLRGAACYGFWFDAVLIKWTNTPTVQEVQTTLGNLNARLRTFKYPKNLPSDVDQFIHGQVKFNDQSLLLVCSTLIEHIVRQALTLSLIGATENYFRNFADLICSGYLDGVT